MIQKTTNARKLKLRKLIFLYYFYSNKSKKNKKLPENYTKSVNKT